MLALCSFTVPCFLTIVILVLSLLLILASNIYIDHEEPLEALAAYKASAPWVLGELLDGHEYLLILPASSTKPAANVFL